ncbi:hypothetical protein C6361_17020 [Plantactinospora sp. BC1]|uniref:hypothetical protein n=1 Tax=Plantactinospora sp. BC1 TaxID=2108470 RepID=UPI000D17E351|nr:hypothetical protein [Plantactinospora sp. BC1]AVT30902.1 hypothetical protein C6361_17020 [Plantactinospora sp. BC1]
MPTSFYVVIGIVAATAFAGWWFYRRFTVDRPPIGVVTRSDIAILLALLVLLPYLYLNLPIAVVTVVLAVGTLATMYVTLEPMLRYGWLALTVGLVLIGADIALGVLDGVTATSFLVVNNLVMVIAIVGATNLWAQSGAKARDIALLAAALTGYDVIATWQLSVMTDVMERLATAPLVPIIGWDLGNLATGLRIGLGDVLILTVFPLVMRKAYGRAAGLVALVLGLTIPPILFALLVTGVVTATIPAMVVIGPLVVGQYFWWRRRAGGRERTTVEYLRAEPLTSQAAT